MKSAWICENVKLSIFLKAQSRYVFRDLKLGIHVHSQNSYTCTAYVCVFCVLVIHYEGVGENRLMKAARSCRLESPLPACVSHQLLTSRAESPLWWVWFSGEEASARRQRFVFRAASEQARRPRRAPPQAWAGQLQRRLQPRLHPAYGALRACREGQPPPQTPSAALCKLDSAQIPASALLPPFRNWPL